MGCPVLCAPLFPQPHAARHRREPRLPSPPENASGRVFPAQEKVVGQAFLPAQALMAEEEGFELKDRILPYRGSRREVWFSRSPGPATPLSAPGARPALRGSWPARSSHTFPWALQAPLALPLVFTDYSSVLGNLASANAQQVTGNRGILLALVVSPLNPPSPPSQGRF